MLVLFTDTDTDITPQVAKEYGYRLISMPYTVGDTDVHPYADSDTFDFKPFYDMLRGGTIPKTSAIGSGVPRLISIGLRKLSTLETTSTPQSTRNVAR